MEDFGFDRGETKDKILFVSKKIFWASAAVFSLACFLFITLSSYNYFYSDKNTNIETIKADDKPLKTFEDVGKKNDNEYAKQIDRAIYEDIFGTKDEKIVDIDKSKIKKNSKPALPPKNNEKKIKDHLVQKDLSEKKVAKKVEKEENNISKNVKKKKRSRTVRVQIAAMTSRESAVQAWKRFNDKYPDLFDNLFPEIQEVDLGKRGVFYRLQAGEFFNQIEAEKFCEKYIKASGKTRSDCIIVE